MLYIIGEGKCYQLNKKTDGTKYITQNVKIDIWIT